MQLVVMVDKPLWVILNPYVILQGKGHLGDIEQSYMTNMGYDEALWAPYNQVPSMYVPRGDLGPMFPTSVMPELYPDDPYDMDPGWRPTGYGWALEGTKGGPVREWGTPPNEDDYYAMEAECQKRTLDFIKKSVRADKPFFISYQPIAASFLGTEPGVAKLTVSASILHEFLVGFDNWLPTLLQTLKDIATALGGQWIELKAGDRVVYHASAVIACNYLVTLEKLATDLWQTFNVPRQQAVQALLPLIRGTIRNIETVGIPDCLTGPIARGDIGTVKKHLDALKKAAPDLLSTYRELGLKTIPVALSKGKIDEQRAKELEAVLTGPTDKLER